MEVIGVILFKTSAAMQRTLMGVWVIYLIQRERINAVSEVSVRYAHPQLFFIPTSRWAIAPVFQLLDICREPGLSPVGYPFVSLEDAYRCAYAAFARASSNRCIIVSQARMTSSIWMESIGTQSDFRSDNLDSGNRLF